MCQKQHYVCEVPITKGLRLAEISLEITAHIRRNQKSIIYSTNNFQCLHACTIIMHILKCAHYTWVTRDTIDNILPLNGVYYLW